MGIKNKTVVSLGQLIYLVLTELWMLYPSHIKTYYII